MTTNRHSIIAEIAKRQAERIAGHLQLESKLYLMDELELALRAALADERLVGQIENDALLKIIHYPECWDTAAYPTLQSALSEVLNCKFKCNNDDCVAKLKKP